jgi:hypothetical protein
MNIYSLSKGYLCVKKYFSVFSIFSVDAESGEGTVVGDDLDVGAVLLQFTFALKGSVLSLGKLGEAPLVGDGDLLSAGEFEFTSSEGFNSVLGVLVGDSDGVEDLMDLDSASFTLGLTEGTSHTGLKSISSGARQHLVDSENVPRVDSASQMETFLTASLDKILVAGNTASLQSLRGDLLLLERNHVNASVELVNTGSLHTGIVYPDSGIGDTSVVSGLGVGLSAPESVASGRSSSHFYDR